MKLFRPHQPLSKTNSPIQIIPILITTTTAATAADNDEKFVSILRNIVRGKKSWRIALNNPFIETSIRPHHVEKVIVQTLDDARLLPPSSTRITHWHDLDMYPNCPPPKGLLTGM